jgi:hypothetical protein
MKEIVSSLSEAVSTTLADVWERLMALMACEQVFGTVANDIDGRY